jgi:hypothetical protein
MDEIRPEEERQGQAQVIPHSPGIYQIRNTVTGDCYIGGTSNVRRRVGGHLSKIRCGTHPNQGIKKLCREHGPDSFVGELLMVCPYHKVLHNEIELIVKHRPSLNVIFPPGTGIEVKGKKKRLELDIPDDLHEAFLSKCFNAKPRTTMKQKVIEFIAKETGKPVPKMVDKRKMTRAEREALDARKPGKP